MNLRSFTVRALVVAVALGLLGVVPATGAPSPDTTTVTGRVTFRGEPVAGLDVMLINLKQTRVVSAVTDAEGNYSFDEPPTTTSHPTATWVLTADGYFVGDGFEGLETYGGNTARRADAVRYRFAPGSSTTIDVEIVEGATLTGRVLNLKGKPVKNAEVRIRHMTHDHDVRVTTDARGYYRSVKLGSGPVEIDAEKGGRQGSTATTLVRGETVTADDIVMQPGFAYGWFTATVTRLKKRDQLYLVNTKTKWRSPLIRDESMKGPVKVREGVSPGTYRLVIAGTNVASKKFEVRPRKTTKLPKLKAPKKRNTIKGKVRNADGSIVTTPWVQVFDSYGTPISGQYGERSKRSYKVKGLGKGTYYVQAIGGSVSTVKVKVKNGKVAKKNVKLRALTTVTGTVTHGSTPVRGIIVEAVQLSETGCIDWGYIIDPEPSTDCIEWFLEETVTDENGRFTLADVPLGALHIQVRDTDLGGYQTLLKKFKITEGVNLNIEVAA